MSSANHDLRRRRISEIALRVIVAEGLEAATVRRIATEVGFSTAVVTHYFADKRDLIFSAYRLMGAMNHAKFETCFARDPPDLVGYLVSMSAVDPDNGDAWRACIGLWDRSLHDAAFAEELASWIAQVVERLKAFMAALHPACPNPDKAASQLFDLVQGLSTRLTVTPGAWSPEEVRQILADEVAALAAPPA